MSDEELYLFSSTNEMAWIEREADGDITIKPISPTLVGAICADISYELSRWLEHEGRRAVFLRFLDLAQTNSRIEVEIGK
jgi:hypothetical protein